MSWNGRVREVGNFRIGDSASIGDFVCHASQAGAKNQSNGWFEGSEGLNPGSRLSNLVVEGHDVSFCNWLLLSTRRFCRRCQPLSVFTFARKRTANMRQSSTASAVPD